jgi:hypothetical protein
MELHSLSPLQIFDDLMKRNIIGDLSEEQREVLATVLGAEDSSEDSIRKRKAQLLSDTEKTGQARSWLVGNGFLPK